MNCKECGKEINKKAEICPHCGCRVKSNNLKIIIICVIVFVLLFFMVYFSGYIKLFFKEQKDNSLLSKYYGEYKLVNGNINDLKSYDPIETQFNTININKENIKIKNSLELAQNYFFVFNYNGKDIIYGGVHMFAKYVDGHSDLDRQLCFKFEDNYLEQIECPDINISGIAFFKNENINLKYQKIN